MSTVGDTLNLIHPLVAKYLRRERMPHMACPGCGIGQVVHATLLAVDELGLTPKDTVWVQGVGCSSRITYSTWVGDNVDAHHGRMFAVATGLKMSRPDMNFICFTGDGDCGAIGGNHFIHACRRNIDITVLLFNNKTYGMTGGQLAPTAPEGTVATTTRTGSIDPPIDSCKLAIAAGATFVARGTSYHTQQLDRLLESGLKHKGFSLIEVLENCNTYYGRPNKIGLLDLLQWEKNNTVNTKAAERMTPEQLQDKILTGLLHQNDRLEYVSQYEQLMARAQVKAGKSA